MIAEIKERREVAEGTLEIIFDLRGEEVEFKPGQIFHVELIDPPYRDEKGSHRHFSITNSPNEKKIISMVTRIRDSAFKRSISEMPIGSEVEIGDIGGYFVLPEDEKTPLVFIAGGIGIAPFVSMSRYIVEEELDYEVKLLYSNRNRNSSIFLDEFKDYELTRRGFDVMLTMTDDPGWLGESSRIDGDFVKRHLPDYRSYTYMIAGPPGMVDSVSGEIEKIGVDGIISSDFTGY